MFGIVQGHIDGIMYFLLPAGILANGRITDDRNKQ